MISIEQLRKFDTKVLCLGTHPGIIQSMLDYDYLSGKKRPSIVAIVADMRKQERYFWGEEEVAIPVASSIKEVPRAIRSKVNTLLMVQSARRILTGMTEALDQLPHLQLATIFAEKVPEQHSLAVAKLADKKKVLVVGPASVGVLIPGVFKLGAIGGTRHPQLVKAGIMKGGDTAVISTSGGMVNELIHAVTRNRSGVSFAMALGGERYPIVAPAQVFLLAEADSATKRIVYFGELGGQDEYELAELIKTRKVTKPVIAYVAGTVSELFDTPPQFGHAKAMAKDADEAAPAKKAALRGVGVTVLDSISELDTQLHHPGSRAAQDPVRNIGQRRKRLIMSSLSGEQQDEVQLLGRDLLTTVEGNSFASLVLSMMLGEQVKSQMLIDFTDYTLRLLVDHGPYQSGAINTIVTARAGRDLVSSLASGLLTIGPRFGGAINGAAKAWVDGVNSGMSPKECVQKFARKHEPIPGIGHKKYRIDLPDPRVNALIKFAPKRHRHLDFALGVQSITVAKKGNLILNVDGTIAAVLLDLLETELSYDYVKLRELADIEFFNAFFVVSRTIGFTSHYLDQRRHDEGLVRFSDEDIAYMPEDRG
jgi:succinyl-CoA synthetase alpha subunit/citrate synthase